MLYSHERQSDTERMTKKKMSPVSQVLVHSPKDGHQGGEAEWQKSGCRKSIQASHLGVRGPMLALSFTRIPCELVGSCLEAEQLRLMLALPMAA